MPRVVVHHAHHADEGENGLYRLVHAEEIEIVVHDAVPRPKQTTTIQVVNEDFIPAPAPDADGNPPIDDREPHQRELLLEQEVEVDDGVDVVERIEKLHVDHQEIVWDAGDARWEGREPEDIAAEQRQIVKDAITRQIAETDRAQIEKENARTDLGSVGTEL